MSGEECLNKKVAFITGITGQDGSYLAELLLAKGYQVHGLKRRASSLNTSRIDHIYQDPHQQDLPLFLHYGDMSDSLALCGLLQKIQPDEIYHLAAQSHVAVSFEAAEYTANVVALGTIRLLEAVRLSGLNCRFFQAATSEMYGKVTSLMQNEDTPFRPCSSPFQPIIAPVYLPWICVLKVFAPFRRLILLPFGQFFWLRFLAVVPKSSLDQFQFIGRI